MNVILTRIFGCVAGEVNVAEGKWVPSNRDSRELGKCGVITLQASTHIKLPSFRDLRGGESAGTSLPFPIIEGLPCHTINTHILILTPT